MCGAALRWPASANASSFAKASEDKSTRQPPPALRSGGGLSEVFFCEGSTGPTFQVTFELLGLFECFKGGVEF